MDLKIKWIMFFEWINLPILAKTLLIKNETFAKMISWKERKDVKVIWGLIINTWQSTDVHLFEILRLQDDNSKFSSRWYVSQWEANVSQLFLLFLTEENMFFNMSSMQFIHRDQVKSRLMIIFFLKEKE